MNLASGTPAPRMDRRRVAVSVVASAATNPVTLVTWMKLTLVPPTIVIVVNSNNKIALRGKKNDY